MIVRICIVLYMQLCGCIVYGKCTTCGNHARETTRTEMHNAKPNIMIIFADDVGIGDIAGKVDTPNIDRLAQQGTSFENAHATPLCAPSRYMLLSGNYQHRGKQPGGTWHLDDHNNFKQRQKSLAKVLQNGGNYTNHVVGKWHLGAKIRPYGMRSQKTDILTSSLHDWTRPVTQGAKSLGFQSSYITFEGIQGSPYAFFRDDYLDKNEVKNWTKGIHEMPHGKSKIMKAGQGSYDWDSTAYNMILVNETIQFLDRHLEDRSNPFFSYVALGSAHIPHSPPEKYLNGDPIAGQYPTAHMDMILELDKVVGSLVQALEDRQLVNNTLIMFLSDNGGLGDNYGSRRFDHNSNAALRGSKGSIYEGGHRIPLIMRYDNVFPSDKQRYHLIGINDIFATICDAAGIQIPKGVTAFDSISFFDYIKNKRKQTPREYLYVQRYKKDILKKEAVITNSFKLIHFLPTEKYNNGRVEYYNLTSDPGERNDLSMEYIYQNDMQELLRKLNLLNGRKDGQTRPFPLLDV